jgi:hypothetical protein
MDALMAWHNAGALARGVQCSMSVSSLPTLAALEKLARLGSDGRQKCHCHRDLMSLLALPKFVLSYFRMKLNCGPRNSRSDWFTQAFLLPHLMLASLYEDFHDSWEKLICPSADALQAFWDTQRGHPGLPGNPLTRRRDWQRRAVPISIHGDGVPVTGVGRSWSKSMVIISFCSLLGAGTTLQSMFVIFCIYGHLLNPSARKIMWHHLTWQFDGIYYI